MTGSWIVPDWPAPAHVKAAVTTRSGGVSQGPHASFNLAAHVDDDPVHVAANRRLLRERLNLPAEPVWLEQVHGADAIDAGQSDDRRADASYTDRPAVVCAVLTADCLPVLFCDTAGTRAAAAHAGWRGLAAGVLRNTVKALELSSSPLLQRGGRGDFQTLLQRFAGKNPPCPPFSKGGAKPISLGQGKFPAGGGVSGVKMTDSGFIPPHPSLLPGEEQNEGLGTKRPSTRDAEIIAWLGPAIGPEAFEVGGEVRDAFLARLSGAEAAFRPHGQGKWLADLYALARLELAEAGVTRVYGGGLCTYSDAERFYSYRRERVTGRMASLIWLADARW